jgi:uncharacterized protein
MLITKDTNNAKYQIQSYGNNLFKVSQQSYQHSLIITPDYLQKWELNSIQEFDLAQAELLTSFKPKIVIIGTGSKHLWLKQEQLLHFYLQNIGIEVMDTKAACRTYSILSSEGRQVVAGLLLD